MPRPVAPAVERARMRAPDEEIEMVDILHRIGVASSPDEVYAALTTIEGLAGWWTEDVDGDGGVGGVLRFRFPPGGFDMRTLEARPAELVLWEVVDGPVEWIDTRIRFQLRQEDGFTIVLFRHESWPEPGEFMHHCSTKWAIFLMSLKDLIETGKGAPSPRDVQVSNWH